MYKYIKFTPFDNNGTPVAVGQALVDFLNENPNIKVVKIDFTGKERDTTIAHLVYNDNEE